jgi:hypothetical protein
MPVRLDSLQAGVAGAVAALIGLSFIPGDRGFWLWLGHGELILAAMILCGLVAALAVRGGRAAIAAAFLALAGASAAAGAYVSLDRDFSPAAFKHAAAEDDLDTLEGEADLAVESRELVGLRRARVRADLGPPDRVTPSGRTWVWQLGLINDGGPGDDGAFYVRFGRDGRVRWAKVF